VTPGGASWLVTTGLLDLAFRDGPLAGPSPLTPGQIYQIDLPLAVIAHRFKAGSRIRLSLSESLWPLVWPSPEVVTLSLHLGESRLTLPARPIPAVEAPFPIPITHPAFSRGEPVLKISDADGAIAVEGAWPASSNTVVATGETLSGRGPDMALSFDPRHPNRSRWTVSQASRFRRSGWDCETQVEIEMTSTAQAFRVRERLTALKDGKVVFERLRDDAIPRRFS
jgi:hypothetical protein